MKLRHKVTGEEFESDDLSRVGDHVVFVWDKLGFRHAVKREVLEFVPVVEEWVNIENSDHVLVSNGVLCIFLRSSWVSYPHPDLRFTEINGVMVLQRRKQ
jgi:hypothetical protein